jgi:hypothetical protein
MNLWLLLLVAAFVTACLWTILALSVDRRGGRFVGLIGAWTATLILAAFWQEDALPGLWDFLQGVVMVWLLAFALLIAAVVLNMGVQEPSRRPLLWCAVLSLLINVAAGFWFLWEATVSPGGV